MIVIGEYHLYYNFDDRIQCAVRLPTATDPLFADTDMAACR